MTPETRLEIQEWGTVYQAVRQGGTLEFEPTRFDEEFTFEEWYHLLGYGGNADKVWYVAKYCNEKLGVTGFYHFLTSLSPEETTPSERV